MDDKSRDGEVARRILRAAIHLFAKKGFAATSTREIVEAAGITKPMLYYYYRSKDGLLRAALSEYTQEARREVDSVLASDLDARSKLVEFVWSVFQFHRENPDFVRMASAMFYGPEDATPGVDILSFAEEVRGSFHRAAEVACGAGIARAGCEEVLVRSLDGMIAAWTRSPLWGGGTEISHDLAEQVVEDLLHGVAPR